jgi:hypothetical protein
MDTLQKIKKYNLMIRPSFCGNWRCGVWQGVDCNIPPRAYCYERTEVEREFLEQAVDDCIEIAKLLGVIN